MKILLFAITSLLSLSSFAQGVLNFDNKEVTLKNLKADDIPTEVVFTFKNTGNQPVIISRVTPVLSTMRADWNKAPITPGASGKITVSFQSAQMTENFNYTIMVLSNAQNSREQLRIGANIVDNPAKEDLLYRFDMSGVKFKSNLVQFSKIYNWQVKSDTVYFFNNRQEPLRIGANYIPAHLSVRSIPEEVAPRKKGALVITYDAPKKDDYGYSYESLILSFNNAKDYNNRLSITADISEDFSKLTKKQIESAPVAVFEKTNIDFGDIKPGEKANCDFILTNKGKSDLIVRKTKASCGCTAIAMGISTIAPGQSGTIRATFDSSGKNGRQSKSITVITNDPKSPEIMVNISGNIKQ